MAMPKLDLKSKCSASSVNEAFSTLMGGGVAKVTEIPIEMLVPYNNQPFKPYSEEKLQLLAEDIQNNGVLNPVLVRQVDEDKFQILAGHNRVNACKKINMYNVPCIIKNVTDVEAELIMLNTNLNQRDELLPSEKAFAYKMQMDAIRLQ
ncbi:MAG: ParB/RepB/Spo0J family partition protein [Oscillospiraceae bacterium]